MLLKTIYDKVTFFIPLKFYHSCLRQFNENETRPMLALCAANHHNVWFFSVSSACLISETHIRLDSTNLVATRTEGNFFWTRQQVAIQSFAWQNRQDLLSQANQLLFFSPSTHTSRTNIHIFRFELLMELKNVTETTCSCIYPRWSDQDRDFLVRPRSQYKTRRERNGYTPHLLTSQ
jgi:hypothetical protein